MFFYTDFQGMGKPRQLFFDDVTKSGIRGKAEEVKRNFIEPIPKKLRSRNFSKKN